MSFLQRLFGGSERRRELDPLYRAIVAAGRDCDWYRAGGVPDTVDGRFAMVAAITALVLLELEAQGEQGREPAVRLTELFIDDMDASLRQIGIGDYVVGKHVGRMMGALGGRLGAFREADGDRQAFREAVKRNVFHDSPPSGAALDWTAERLARFRDGLEAGALAAGRVPEL